MISGRHSIFDESNLRSVAIYKPQINVAVKIPVASSEGSTIVGQVQMGGSRNIGKGTITGIHKDAVRLSPAKRPPLAYEP